jgi:lipopolysaccharide export system permease protein
MRSFGVPMGRLFLPIGALAALLTLVMLALTSWVQPQARFLFREKMNAIVSQDILGSLTPGVFLSIGTDYVLRAKSVTVRGQSFEGFFVARKTEPGVQDFVTSTTAEVVKNKESAQTGTLDLNLANGMFIREKETDGVKAVASQAKFEGMQISIPTNSVVDEPGPRGSDEQELTGWELFHGGAVRPANSPATATPAQIRAELHWRVIEVLSLPVLGALALPLALLGRGRSARASGLGVGLVVLVLFEKTTRLGKVLVEGGHASPWLSLWIPWVVLIVVTFLAYRQFSGDRGRRPRGGKTVKIGETVAAPAN